MSLSSNATVQSSFLGIASPESAGPGWNLGHGKHVADHHAAIAADCDGAALQWGRTVDHELTLVTFVVGVCVNDL